MEPLIIEVPAIVVVCGMGAAIGVLVATPAIVAWERWQARKSVRNAYRVFRTKT